AEPVHRPQELALLLAGRRPAARRVALLPQRLQRREPREDLGARGRVDEPRLVDVAAVDHAALATTQPLPARADNARMLSWLFRSQCAACGVLAPALCEPCAASLVELGPACPRCAEPTGEVDVVCTRCLHDPLPLERIVSPWRFGGPLAAAIRRLKFA